MSFELPRECYREMTHEQAIRSESNEGLFIEKFDWENVISVYIKGARHPYKVFVSSQILSATNIVKSLFIESMKVLATPLALPIVLSAICSKNALQRLLEVFNRQAWRVISPYILKDKHLTTTSRELHLLVFMFLFKLGIKEEVADRFASIFQHLIEYDNAYRLRVVDIFSETSNSKLQKPRKEIARLMNIISIREKYISDIGLITTKVDKKFKVLVSVMRMGLLVPRFKRAFIEAINTIDIKNLQYDESDLYWTANRKDYLFWGKTYEERMQMAKDLGWNYPENYVEPTPPDTSKHKTYWSIKIHEGKLEIVGQKLEKKPKGSISLKKAQDLYKKIEGTFNRAKDKEVKKILLPIIAKNEVK